MDRTLQQVVAYGAADDKRLLMGVVENMDGGENFFGKRHLNIVHGSIIAAQTFSNERE